MCVSVCARARVRAPGCMCACVHARTAAWTRLAGFPYSERGIKRSQVVDIHLYIYCRTVHLGLNWLFGIRMMCCPLSYSPGKLPWFQEERPRKSYLTEHQEICSHSNLECRDLCGDSYI